MKNAAMTSDEAFAALQAAKAAWKSGTGTREARDLAQAAYDAAEAAEAEPAPAPVAAGPLGRDGIEGVLRSLSRDAAGRRGGYPSDAQFVFVAALLSGRGISSRSAIEDAVLAADVRGQFHARSASRMIEALKA